MTDWRIDDSRALYGLEDWGSGFFDINDAGNVSVAGGDRSSIDLLDLVRDLQRRGMRTPMLLRFSDVLARRVGELAEAFERATSDHEYTGHWRGVYPIKVNQQAHVVEEVVQHGAALGVGLEAGSKPELLVALAVLDTPGATIICNGYKDRAYIETALLAQQLGRNPVIVVDRYRELELLIKTSHELGIRPRIGVRARLWARGAGKWVESTGSRSKFGLSPAEIVAAVDRLRAEDMLGCLELLHCHIGSQITSIQAHKEALREVSRIYVGLRELGAGLTTIDVGGGLGVDYDGTQSDFHSSMNYSMQEYANDVVGAMHEACEQAGEPHPDVITESGRAMVAHHSVLVFDVLGVHEMTKGGIDLPVSDDDERVLQRLAEVRDEQLDSPNESRLLEAYHDAVTLRDEAASLFSLGYLDLTGRARAERLYFECCERIRSSLRELDTSPDELAALEQQLADTYYGNFSVFQSAPDHWAVKQLFPVMPIHRHDEEPERRGVFADLTCDSDGKIDRFIGPAGERRQLPLHEWGGDPYYVGVFLVGAYQEILGDLHNLFGDTDAVHVRLDADGSYHVDHVVEGDDVSEVLHYVQYERRDLVERVRRAAERAGARRPAVARGLRAAAQALRRRARRVHLPVSGRRLKRTVAGHKRSKRVISWNVNGIRAATKKGFGQWLGRSRAEIVGVQEVRALPDEVPQELLRKRGWHHHFAPAERRGYSGVGLFAKRAPDKVETSLGEVRFDVEGRIQLAHFGRLVVANGYFPKGSGKERDNSRVGYKLDFYAALFERVQKLRRGGKRVLVMGDFNTAHDELDLARPKDNKKNSGFLPEERAELDRWVDAGWVDTFRARHPGEDGHYSWWKQWGGARENNIGWRIDYVFASPSAMKFVERAFILPNVTGSDHCPVGVDVDESIFG